MVKKGTGRVIFRKERTRNEPILPHGGGSDRGETERDSKTKRLGRHNARFSQTALTTAEPGPNTSS